MSGFAGGGVWTSSFDRWRGLDIQSIRPFATLASVRRSLRWCAGLRGDSWVSDFAGLGVRFRFGGSELPTDQALQGHAQAAMQFSDHL